MELCYAASSQVSLTRLFDWSLPLTNMNEQIRIWYYKCKKQSDDVWYVNTRLVATHCGEENEQLDAIRSWLGCHDSGRYLPTRYCLIWPHIHTNTSSSSSLSDDIKVRWYKRSWPESLLPYCRALRPQAFDPTHWLITES